MLIAAVVVLTLAAALHIAIFYLESFAWTRPAVWKRFRLDDQAHANGTRALAYNQGFYNLFLALGLVIGLILFGAGLRQAGLALALFTCACMVAAAVVLLTTDRGFVRGALVQGTLPLIGGVLLLLS